MQYKRYKLGRWLAPASWRKVGMTSDCGYCRPVQKGIVQCSHYSNTRYSKSSCCLNEVRAHVAMFTEPSVWKASSGNAA